MVLEQNIITPHFSYSQKVLWDFSEQDCMHALDFFNHVDGFYGGEEEDDGYTYSIISNNRVHVPQNMSLLDESDYLQLLQLIDPLSESSNYGIDLYEQTVEFIMLHPTSYIYSYSK